MRLYEAVGDFLAAIAVPHALLLLLDDLQWADTATLDLLCYVVRHQPDARLLILGAYREGEVTHRLAFERALAELNRLRRLSTTAVGPLADVELTALAADYLGTPIDPAVSHLLSKQSEGNPFFAEELLRGWLETGTIARDHTSFRLIAPVESSLSSSIVGAVRQRLTRLSPQVVELLRMAAIIGRTFDVTLLVEVASQEVETAEDHLQEAIQALLIRCDQPGTFTFIHDTIRECLYSEVNSARRTRLHTLIGRLLEQQLDLEHAQTDAQRLANLAFHFARSGERQLGAVYSQQAAEQALQTYAPQEAMTHYRTALTLLGEDDPRRGACLLGLGEAAHFRLPWTGGCEPRTTLQRDERRLVWAALTGGWRRSVRRGLRSSELSLCWQNARPPTQCRR
jgi:predicted ATPase